MPLIVKITSETKDKGVFRASGVVTAPDGSEKGKAVVYVTTGVKGPKLVLAEAGKTTILGNEVTEYKSFEGPTAAETPELAKDVELTFSKLSFAI
ncbi:hypothetical protein Q5H92_22870 [Hymenobacter sp. M29]|uniref:Head decoration protein n=1 Tax=Hymenobacter mellowenesis TaxID=3063995 RepID=A0ABT9AH69_9BACT|nr:hypothetical protein [Hymenobacter sp. M29]MDO7849225.1 hypothetical protein [Hymenobacter sp. M29]